MFPFEGKEVWILSLAVTVVRRGVAFRHRLFTHSSNSATIRRSQFCAAFFLNSTQQKIILPNYILAQIVCKMFHKLGSFLIEAMGNFSAGNFTAWYFRRGKFRWVTLCRATIFKISPQVIRKIYSKYNKKIWILAMFIVVFKIYIF